MFMLHEPFEPKGDNLRFEFEEGQKQLGEDLDCQTRCFQISLDLS